MPGCFNDIEVTTVIMSGQKKTVAIELENWLLVVVTGLY